MKNTETAKQESTNDYNLENAEPFRPRPHFEIDNQGVWWVNVRTNKNGDIIESDPLLLSEPIDIIGTGQDNDGAYYRIIKFRDKNTRQQKTAALPQEEIGTAHGWKRLGWHGIDVYSEGIESGKLRNYLLKHSGNAVFTITDRAGWNGEAYILAGGEAINADGTNILYNGDTSQKDGYTEKGSLKEWQEQAARYAENNSRLCLALGLSMAAPFLALLNEEGGGFHLAGDSSKGKTTAARLALSVWGDPETTKGNWDTTPLGLQNLALARNDGLLVLDEIGQTADPRKIPQMVYSVINGVSKTQGAKDGGNRRQKTWRNLILSTGEINPESLIGGSAQWKAGNHVRLPDIQAEARYGIYDTLHGFTDGAKLSEHINQATAKQRGTAGRALIRQILKDGKEAASQAVEARRAQFLETLPPMGGQARRIARRFALLAAVLEYAAPITGMRQGAGEAGVKQCFNEWLEENGTGNREDRQIIEQVTAFMDVNALSMRFSDWNAQTVNQHHAGYRKQEGSIDEFWIIPVVFEDEVCKGYSQRKVCEVLHNRQWLKKADNGRWQHQRKRNGSASRFYVLMGEAPPDFDE
jgi:putative prophage primase|nr:MAG TPA: Superfamily II helicase [Bacteriophage sp.]